MVINNENEYQNALTRLEVIFDADKFSDNGLELEELSLAIENYENENYPISPPDK